MSLKNTILYLIKSQGDVSFDELYSLAEENSRKPDNLTRRCRELCHEGLISPIKQRNREGIEYISGYRII
jgi:predicted transcriptional regulator